MAAPRQVLEREPIQVVEFALPEESRAAYYAQRVVEWLIAVVVLVITAPVMAVITAGIRAGTKGPALFKQIRVGKNQQPFRFVKYRTLYADARTRFPELYC